MNHTDTLNLLLANACPANVTRGDGSPIFNPGTDKKMSDDLYTFNLDLHCVNAVITARLVSTVETIQYEIVSCEME
jgi:hypothetical protein